MWGGTFICVFSLFVCLAMSKEAWVVDVQEEQEEGGPKILIFLDTEMIQSWAMQDFFLMVAREI